MFKDFRFSKERTSRWMPLCLIAPESNVNLPDLAAREDGWEVASLILLCEVLLVWNHRTSSGSRLSRLLLVPTEDLHFLTGLCGLWIQGRWENVAAHLELLRREFSLAWQRHWQTSIRPQYYSCRPEALIGIIQPLCWALSSCSLVNSSKYLVVCLLAALSNESTGGLNSSDSRISVDRMTIKNISFCVVFIEMIYITRLKKLSSYES